LEAERFRCPLPAAALDVRLKLEDFVPRYLWGIEIAPGKDHDLGTIPLKKGASVVGWVRSEGSPPAGADRRVDLTPEIPGPDSIPVPGELRGAMARQASVNARGFFQFEDVLPGTYAVTASQAGAISSRVFPVQVLPGLEAEIRDPLVLSKPISVKVIVDPPVDPAGSPWKVALRKRFDQVLEGFASQEGIWEPGGLGPGLYNLTVSGVGGSRWVSEELEVKAGQPPIRIEMPVLWVQGRVTLGGEPLAATLWFGGLSGPRRIRFQSDEKGRFEGVLPQEGTWTVDLWSGEDRLRLALDPVEVKVPQGKSHAWIELAVPDTRLAGEVVDEQGHPLPSASVIVSHKVHKNSQFLTDKEGKFELQGIPPGRSLLEAHAGERTSGWVEVAVEEGRDAPWLRLVARAKVEIQGRVTSPLRPVAGARLQALPQVETGSLATVVEAVSGVDGGFSLPLPAGTRSISLMVHAPGFGLRMLQAAVDPERFLEVPVEASGGMLVFDLGDSEGKAGAARAAVLFHGGVWMGLEALAYWAQGKPLRRGLNSLAISGMEPGEYLLCVAGEGVRIEDLRGTSSCTSGYLSPLQELVLTVPDLQPPAARGVAPRR
jgi:hypothetical protein